MFALFLLRPFWFKLTYYFCRTKDFLVLLSVQEPQSNIRRRAFTDGAIDWYSCLIVFLNCSNNNRAETVLRFFFKAVNEYDLPSRICSDKGRENVDVALYMLEHPSRNSAEEVEEILFAFSKLVALEKVNTVYRMELS